MAFALSLSPAAAKPLLSETCVKLAGEHVELRKAGIEEAMDQQDPQKAGEALKPDDLAKIERYLFIEGQIRFRCPEIKLPSIKNPKNDKSKESGSGAAKKKPAKKSRGTPSPTNQNLFTQLEDRG